MSDSGGVSASTAVPETDPEQALRWIASVRTAEPVATNAHRLRVAVVLGALACDLVACSTQRFHELDSVGVLRAHQLPKQSLELLEALGARRFESGDTAAIIERKGRTGRLLRRSFKHLDIALVAFEANLQAKGIREADRVIADVAVQIDPTGDADRVFLGETPGCCARLRPRTPNRERLPPLAAHPS